MKNEIINIWLHEKRVGFVKEGAPGAVHIESYIEKRKDEAYH